MRSSISKLALVANVLGLTSAYLVDPPSTAASDTISDCSGWVIPESSDTCASIAATYVITEDQFKTYNPSLKSGCTFKSGNSYCIEQNWGVPVPTPTPSSTTPGGPSKPTNGISTPSPIQTGMTGNCNKFYKVVSGDGCYDIAAANSISLDDFYAWNPAVGTNCASLWANTYVCVGVIGGSTPTPTPTPSATPKPSTTPKPTPTTTGNGITTPTPVQPSMVPNCNGFYLVKAGDGCYDIAAANSISLDQFYAWNPYVQTDCSRLWSGYNVCVRTIGSGNQPASSTFKTSAKPTTTKPSSSTPTPVQQGMVANCKKFYKVVSGDGCWAIANTNGISLDDFYKWNPAVKTDCSALWAQYYVCVGI